MEWGRGTLPHFFRNKYLILGNEEFPNQATGIAFCKESWTELTKKNCSGFYLLQSLGIKIDQARRKYPDGASDLFCLMLNYGLLCWNVKELGSLFNLGLPNKSIKVIVCGPQAAVCYDNSKFIGLCKKIPFYIPRHPSGQGVSANDNDHVWHQFWEKPGALIRQLSSIYKDVDDLKEIIDIINQNLRR